jgi:hypothetical protein
MSRPYISGGPETDVFTAASLAAAVAVTPPLEIGCLLRVTAGADTGRLYRRTALAGIVADFELVDSLMAADQVNVPAGGLVATDLQAAIDELDTDKGNAGAIVNVDTLLLAAIPVFAANSTAQQVFAIALPATAVILSTVCSALPVADVIISQAFNDGAGNAVVRLANVSGAPVALLADPNFQIAWYDPATW